MIMKGRVCSLEGPHPHEAEVSVTTEPTQIGLASRKALKSKKLSAWQYAVNMNYKHTYTSLAVCASVSSLTLKGSGRIEVIQIRMISSTHW